jgi:hypothetical protein
VYLLSSFTYYLLLIFEISIPSIDLSFLSIEKETRVVSYEKIVRDLSCFFLVKIHVFGFLNFFEFAAILTAYSINSKRENIDTVDGDEVEKRRRVQKEEGEAARVVKVLRVWLSSRVL